MNDKELFNQWLFLQKKRNRIMNIGSILIALIVVTLIYTFFLSYFLSILFIPEGILIYKLYLRYNFFIGKMNKIADLLRYGTVEEQEKLNKNNNS